MQLLDRSFNRILPSQIEKLHCPLTDPPHRTSDTHRDKHSRCRGGTAAGAYQGSNSRRCLACSDQACPPCLHPLLLCLSLLQGTDRYIDPATREGAPARASQFRNDSPVWPAKLLVWSDVASVFRTSSRARRGLSGPHSYSHSRSGRVQGRGPRHQDLPIHVESCPGFNVVDLDVLETICLLLLRPGHPTGSEDTRTSSSWRAHFTRPILKAD